MDTLMTLTKKDVSEKPEHRLRILKKIYELTEGNPNKHIELVKVIKEASLQAYGGLQYGQELARYWMDKNYLHAMEKGKNMKKVRLTAYGIDFIEPQVLADLSQ